MSNLYEHHENAMNDLQAIDAECNRATLVLKDAETRRQRMIGRIELLQALIKEEEDSEREPPLGGEE